MYNLDGTQKNLVFGKGNSKLIHTGKMIGLKKSQVRTFALPAGKTCPAASLCHSKTVINDETGKKQIVDGKDNLFRCYATKAEAIYPAVYNARNHNMDSIKNAKTTAEIVELIQTALNDKKNKSAKLVRIHDSGDFFNKAYYMAWLQIAIDNPNILFFGYTKMLPFAVNAKSQNLDNFFVQYSYGGLADMLRDSKFSDLATCYVITDNEWSYNAHRTSATNNDTGIIVPIVCDGHENGHQDYLAIVAGKSFGIPVH